MDQRSHTPIWLRNLSLPDATHHDINLEIISDVVTPQTPVKFYCGTAIFNELNSIPFNRTEFPTLRYPRQFFFCFITDFLFKYAKRIFCICYFEKHYSVWWKRTIILEALKFTGGILFLGLQWIFYKYIFLDVLLNPVNKHYVYGKILCYS